VANGGAVESPAGINIAMTNEVLGQTSTGHSGFYGKGYGWFPLLCAALRSEISSLLDRRGRQLPGSDLPKGEYG